MAITLENNFLRNLDSRVSGFMSLAGFLYNVYFIGGAVDKDIVCTEAGELDPWGGSDCPEGQTNPTRRFSDQHVKVVAHIDRILHVIMATP